MYPGKPYPLGATWDGKGVNFALYAEHATKVELCLFDAASGQLETCRYPFYEKSHQIWHCYLPGWGRGNFMATASMDSAPFVPKCVVVDDRYDWKGDWAPLMPVSSI
jgi:pullulanase/glycogen debranching enzyme